MACLLLGFTMGLGIARWRRDRPAHIAARDRRGMALQIALIRRRAIQRALKGGSKDYEFVSGYNPILGH